MSFDNSYSYLKSKTVRYHIEVPPPEPRRTHTPPGPRAIRGRRRAGVGGRKLARRAGPTREAAPVARRVPAECPDWLGRLPG